MRKQAGFTLLEMLTVLAIVGIFVLIAIPALKGYNQSTGIRASAKQIAGDLWLARQKAITTSTPHSIRFESGESSYTLFSDDGGGNPANCANGTLDSGETVIRTRRLSRECAFSDVNLDPANSVIFEPRGMLRTGTAGGYVTVSDSDSRSRTVEIMASGLTRTM